MRHNLMILQICSWMRSISEISIIEKKCKTHSKFLRCEKATQTLQISSISYSTSAKVTCQSCDVSHAADNKPRSQYRDRFPLPSWVIPATCALRTDLACRWSCSQTSPWTRPGYPGSSSSPVWPAHWQTLLSVGMNEWYRNVNSNKNG